MLALTVLAASAAIDGKKPKIMVFPSDDWCMRNGYLLDDGKTPDYERALQNEDMDGAIAVLGDLMASEGCEMFSLKQELKQLHTEGAYDMVVTSKGDGFVQEDDRDIVTRNVGVDFIVEMAMDVKPFGARRSMSFKLQTIDAASRKILHGDVGNSAASSSPVNLHVKEAVGAILPNFCEKIAIAMAKIDERGREGSIAIKIADDCPLNLESEVTVAGESGELADYIAYWLEEHAKDTDFSITQKSRNSMRIDQVHFPATAAAGSGGFGSRKGRTKSHTMESFFKEIDKDLRLLGLSVTTVPIGQGQVYVVLGGR